MKRYQLDYTHNISYIVEARDIAHAINKCKVRVPWYATLEKIYILSAQTKVGSTK